MTEGRIGTKIIKLEKFDNNSIVMELVGPKGNLKLICNLDDALKIIVMGKDSKKKMDDYIPTLKRSLEGKVLFLDFHLG